MSKQIVVSFFLAITFIFIITNSIMAENSTKYLPMAKGRFWEYKIEVPKGGNYLSLRRMLFNDRIVYSTLGQNPLKEGTYTLCYVVKGRTEDPNVWEIKVEKDTLNLYSNVAKVLWVFGKSDKGIITVTEELIYTREFAMSYGPSMGMMPATKAEGSNLLFFEQPENSNYAIGSGDTQCRYLSSGDSISVPAGTFQNCVVMAEEVKPSDKPESSFLPSLGWVTMSTWAPNTGLVQKTQLSASKKNLWKMQLTKSGVK